MASETIGARLSDIIKYEVDKNFVREEVTVVSGQNLKKGAVIGKITASGKYQEHDPAETNGAETAAGVLLQDVDASAADKVGVAMLRGPAIVDENGLVYITGISQANKDAANTDLENINILVRTGV